MADEKEPRRFKLPSECSDDDRAVIAKLGGGRRRPERDEYVAWRDRMLRDERDDLELRGRLLGEQAEELLSRASDQRRSALEQLTAEDHDDHLAEIRAAKDKGIDPPTLDDGGAAKLERRAAAMEDEANEIRTYLAEEAASCTQALN